MARARAKNPRGQGEQLRAELLAAANELLDRSGDPASVTVRGVAGAVGVVPNAVYLHFADRAALLDALVADRFAAFGLHLRSAIAQADDDPVDRLRAGHAAYVDFALTHPGHYRLLFGGYGGPLSRGPGAEAFGILVDGCRALVDAGVIAGADPERLAVSLWAFEHGYVELRLSGMSTLPAPVDALDALLAAMMQR